MAILKSFKCHPIIKNKWFNSILVYLNFLMVTFSTSVFAGEDVKKDLLEGVLEGIKANFGLSSVFIKCLYLMEIYYGWRKYRETNNPFAVGSIVLVALALTYAIGKWVG